MKIALAFIAGAAATAPVISLDLEGAGLKAVARSTHGTHFPRHKTFTKANTAKVHVCQARNANAKKNCALPVAKAYDHHDGALAVTTKVFLAAAQPASHQKVKLGLKGTCKQQPGSKTSCATRFINYNVRSESIVKYDAKDASGNNAEQVVFAVILEDHTAPKISLAYYPKKLEAIGNKKCTWNKYPKSTVTDNIDFNIKATNNCKTINLHQLGTTQCSYQAHDFAKSFGKDGKSNWATKQIVKITVRDTTKPIITRIGNNKVIECSFGYKDQGASMTDSHDSAICKNGKYKGLSKKVLAQKIRTTNPVNHMKVGVYTVKYNGKDFQGLAATQKTRKVTVRDTLKPVLKVCTGGSHAWKRFTNKGAQVSHNNQKGNRAMKIQAGQHKKHHNMDFKKGQGCLDHHIIQHSAGYTKDIQVISNLMKAQQSSTCTDKCTKTTTKTSMHTGSCKGPKVAFNTLKPASYFVKYHCADKNGNSVTKCRTVVNEDHTKPVLDILGNDLMTIEATYHKNYVDDGATCSDQVDDVISQQVEVSGDVVNLSKIGTYKITYKCKDTAGNAADPLTRTVVVKDTTCPTCKLNGGKKTQKVVREASFPYSDLGATCTDNIDGARPTKRTGTFNVETTGTYVLTYSASDKSGNTIGKGKCKHTTRRTIVVKDTLKPVISLHFGGKKIHQSRANDKGVNGQANKAKFARYNPYFMEETQTSVNGWVMGAIASAVTGVALLGYSMKKTAVATSVPV